MQGCPCHDDCLKPGHTRRVDCKGEHRCGCRNCVCFGLVSDTNWKKLTQERPDIGVDRHSKKLEV